MCDAQGEPTRAFAEGEEGEPDIKLRGELHPDGRPSLRCDEREAIPKVVFSHTLDSVQGNARLAEARWPRKPLRR